MRKRLFAIALAAAAITAGPAFAQLNIIIGTPPPQPQYEAVPPGRDGYAWAPGFWGWQNNQHVWMPGHWIEARQGKHWVPDRWVDHQEGERKNWRHEQGHWDDGRD